MLYKVIREIARNALNLSKEKLIGWATEITGKSEKVFKERAGEHKFTQKKKIDLLLFIIDHKGRIADGGADLIKDEYINAEELYRFLLSNRLLFTKKKKNWQSRVNSVAGQPEVENNLKKLAAKKEVGGNDKRGYSYEDIIKMFDLNNYIINAEEERLRGEGAANTVIVDNFIKEEENSEKLSTTANTDIVDNFMKAEENIKTKYKEYQEQFKKLMNEIQNMPYDKDDINKKLDEILKLKDEYKDAIINHSSPYPNVYYQPKGEKLLDAEIRKLRDAEEEEEIRKLGDAKKDRHTTLPIINGRGGGALTKKRRKSKKNQRKKNKRGKKARKKNNKRRKKKTKRRKNKRKSRKKLTKRRNKKTNKRGKKTRKK